MIFQRTSLLLSQIKVDFCRSVISWKFLYCLVGFIVAMLLSAKTNYSWSKSVMLTMIMVINSYGFLITYILCAFVYADSFCQDLEHKYIYQQLVHRTLGIYTLSKILMIVISALLLTVLGIIGFALIVRIYFPWYEIHDGVYKIALIEGGLRSLLLEKHFIIYYILFGIQYGIYMAVLALLSAFGSLFITNKLFVLSIPLLANYIVSYICVYLHPDYNVMIIFNPMYNLWGNDMLAFWVPILVGILSIAIIGRAIYVKLRRRIENE